MQALIVPLLFLAVYVTFIRPQRRRAQSKRALLTQLAPGDQVVTAGGMIATLRSMDADRATVEVSPGVLIELLAPAIVRRLDPSMTSGRGTDAVGDTGLTGPLGTGDVHPGDVHPGDNDRPDVRSGAHGPDGLVDLRGDTWSADDAAPGGAAPGGAVPGGAAPGGAAPSGAAPGGAAPGGAAPGGAAPGGAAPGGAAPGGAAPGKAGGLRATWDEPVQTPYPKAPASEED